MGSSTFILIFAIIEYNVLLLTLKKIPTCKTALTRMSSYSYAKIYGTLWKNSLVFLFMIILNLKYVWQVGLWKALYSQFMAETMSSLISILIGLDLLLFVLYEIVLYRNRLEVERPPYEVTEKTIQLLEI